PRRTRCPDSLSAGCTARSQGPVRMAAYPEGSTMNTHPTPILSSRRELPLSDTRLGISALFTADTLKKPTLFAERLLQATHGRRAFGAPSIGGLSAEDFVQQAVVLAWEGTRKVYVEEVQPFTEEGDAAACLKAIKHCTYGTIAGLIWEARRKNE